MADPREAWLLTAPRLMPEGVGDLGLGEVEVVAQGQHLALALGQLPHRVEYGVPPGGGERGLVGTGTGGAEPPRGRRAGRRRRGAAAPSGTGSRPPAAGRPAPCRGRAASTSDRARRRTRPARPPRRWRRRAPGAPRAGPAAASGRRTAARARCRRPRWDSRGITAPAPEPPIAWVITLVPRARQSRGLPRRARGNRCPSGRASSGAHELRGLPVLQDRGRRHPRRRRARPPTTPSPSATSTRRRRRTCW